MSTHFRPSEYHRPESIDEALRILGNNPGDAKVIAGGTDLLVSKPVGTKILVDISRLPLSYIEEGDVLRIGATTNFNAIQASEHLRENPLKIMSEASGEIGHYNLRHLATIGGNLCNAVPSADAAIPLIALDAEAVIAGVDKDRMVKFENFFTFVQETVLDESEILKEIRIPQQPPGTGASFERIGRTNVDIALVNAAVRLTLDDERVCADSRIVLGAVAPTPIRVSRAEEMLLGMKLTNELIEEAAGTASQETKPISDVRTSSEYRREMSKVLVRRALKKALSRAMGE